MKTAPVLRALAAVSAMALVYFDAPPAMAQPSGCTVSLQPSEPSPQLVGERIIWTATAANCGAAPVYQFGVAARAEGRDGEGPDHERGRPRFAMVRDFSLDHSFAWAPMQEGRYAIRVAVKDGFDAVQATSSVVSDEVDSRVTGDDAVVTPTLNPLVALYSAPPCRDGAMRVQFRPTGGPTRRPVDEHQHAALRAGREPELRRGGDARQHHLRDGPPGGARRGRAPALHDRDAPRDA